MSAQQEHGAPSGASDLEALEHDERQAFAVLRAGVSGDPSLEAAWHRWQVARIALANARLALAPDETE
jgi:hypothetical protein